MKKRNIVISESNRQRLRELIEWSRRDPRAREDYLAALEAELRRARVMPDDRVPPDAVTMDSVVRLRDLDTGEAEEYALVDPADADLAYNRISILAPIGTAILGYRVGDVLEWPVPAGLCRVQVEEVVYQPERAGALRR